MDSPRQKARNAILGAIIGDAFGTTFEFMKSNTAKEFLSKNSFENGLLGGGPFNVDPGQFTDDTELALASMYVIDKFGKYDQEEVAKAYHRWYKSPPFDIGITTKKSVSQDTAKKMITAAKNLNANSMSNGSLMRLFGLVALHYDKPSKDLVKAVKEDIALTHSKPEMSRIAIIYATMLMMAIKGSNAMTIYNYGRYLSNLTDSTEDAVMNLIEYGKVISVYSPLFSIIYDTVDHEDTLFKYNGQVYEKRDIDGYAQGFVGYAIWLLLDCLKNNYDYKTSMYKIAEYGGDTDTIGVVVGAILGAIHGQTIPKIWIDSVLNCKAVNRYQEYPIADPAVWTKFLPQ